MALVFIGQTECAICGQLLLQGDAIRALPPISATQHPLWSYFDRGLHAQCFENWGEKAEALRLVEEQKLRFIESASFKEMVAKYGRPDWLDEWIV